MMALAYMDQWDGEWQRASWFVSHVLHACGQWGKRPPALKRLLEQLAAPVASGGPTFTIRSLADLKRYEEETGVSLLPKNAERE